MSAPMMTRASIIAGTIAIVLAWSAWSASAQRNQVSASSGPPNALQGFSQNRDQPVKIRAASLEVREKDKQATFAGDVHVIQGDTELRCKSLVIFYDEDAGAQKTAKAGEGGGMASKSLRKIEAKGGVTVTQKDQHATGDTVSFDMRANVVTLTGNVVVTRGSDVLRGQRLVVDLASGVTKMDSGRVEGLFQRVPDRK
jgi:lipopolysaccharide export system protein LptA